jgi:uncharacterized alpha-E superfamily protein
MKSYIATIKSNIANTILHDDIYNFISAGIHIERALQILRIVRNKISDWIILSNNGENKALISYQWTILLKSLEAYDVHNTFYRGQRTKENIFKLIFENPIFPRSIAYSVAKIQYAISRISVIPEGFDDLIHYFEHELIECTKGNNFKDEEEVLKLIDDSYKCISQVHYEINRIYFN